MGQLQTGRHMQRTAVSAALATQRASFDFVSFLRARGGRPRLLGRWHPALPRFLSLGAQFDLALSPFARVGNFACVGRGMDDRAMHAARGSALPCPEAGPPCEAYRRLVDGFGPPDHGADAAVAIDAVERAYYVVFFPAAVARYRQLRRRCVRMP